MKKLLFTLIVSMLFLAAICQDTKPTVTTFKQLQSPQFWFNSADTSVWMYKGNVYGWTQLQRTSKKYPIWNHTSITNTGWSTGMVLGFNSSGNLVPLSPGAGGITGSGTAGYIPKFTAGTVIGDSPIYAHGTDIAIGSTDASGYKLKVTGNVYVTQQMTQNQLGVGSTPISGVRAYINSAGDGVKALVIRANSLTQTANLQEWQNNSGVAFSVIDKVGNLGIGQTSPAAYLHIKAGTATASTAPLKFTAGTNLATPEAGAVEFDGTHYYGTIGTTRYQLDQQGGGYTLPVATTSVLGGVKQGAGTTIAGDGTVSVSTNYEAPLGNPAANTYVLSSTTGGVRSWIPKGIALTDLSAGGSGISYDNTTGQFYVSGGYSIPTTTQKNNFITAYGWGDHAGLYAPLSHVGATGTAHGNATASVAGFMTAADFTKLGTIASYADNYGSWNIDANLGTPASVNSGQTVKFFAGTGIVLNQYGREITINATGGGSMVYPGAGIALSNGSGWGTSITNNSANWNTAYTNMGKSLVSGEASYYNLSDTYFMSEFSLIRPKFGTATYANLLPVTGGEVYSKLLTKQDNLNLTTDGTTGAATFDGVNLNIPQYAGGTNYWSTDAYGIYRSGPVAINGTNTVGYDQTVHGRANFLYTGGATAYAISSESNGTLANFYALNTGANGAGIFCNATGTGSFGGILQGQRSDLKVSMDDTAPASATATGQVGEIRVTAGYIYVCTATNTWVRAALSTW